MEKEVNLETEQNSLEEDYPALSQYEMQPDELDNVNNECDQAELNI